MASQLRGRSFLKELDFGAGDILELLDLARELKADRQSGREARRLVGKNVALIFEKTSTRTRCAFEVAAHDQGAHVTYLGPEGSQIGHKESIRDTARVLGRMYDGIEYRGYGQDIVETLAAYAGVPVWNGLTDEWHPTQSLADVLTMTEHSEREPHDISLAYVGDARNNVARSLLCMGAILGMDVRLGAPRELWPPDDVIGAAHGRGREAKARLLVTEDPTEAVRGADYVYTDVWVSMGEPAEAWSRRIELLRPFQVTAALMDAAGPESRFLHCLPAFHDRQTKVGERIFQEHGLDGLEVTDEVFESWRSVVWDQAENRMHTIKAVMVATMAE